MKKSPPNGLSIAETIERHLQNRSPEFIRSMIEVGRLRVVPGSNPDDPLIDEESAIAYRKAFDGFLIAKQQRRAALARLNGYCK